MFKILGSISRAVDSIAEVVVGLGSTAEDTVNITADEVRQVGKARRYEHVLQNRDLASEFKGKQLTKSELSYIETRALPQLPS